MWTLARVWPLERVRNHISFVVWFVGLSYGALGLYRTHETVVLSPGLHLIGLLAALWITLRLLWLMMLRIVRMMLRRAPAVPLPSLPLHAALKRMRMIGRRSDAPPKRWVPRRREFGLRGTSR